MNQIGLVTALLLLAGCGAPQGVVDTASLVAKLSTQMNGKLTDYVSTQNQLRAGDATRIGDLRARTDMLTAANQDQFDILDVAADDHTLKVLKAVKAGRVEGPALGDAPAVRYSKTLAAEFGKNSFDGAPLNNVAKVAGDIAKPDAFTDEVKSVVAFGQQIYSDITKSNKPAQ